MSVPVNYSVSVSSVLTLIFPIGNDYSAGHPHNGFRHPADRCS